MKVIIKLDNQAEQKYTFAYMQNLFINIPSLYPLYFFYGAAFLFLGVSIAVKNMKGSDLKLASSLWLLGMFGFTHGAHEWLELYPLIQGEYLSLREIFLAKLITVCMVIISFVFLLQFGLKLLRVLDNKCKMRVRVIPAILFLIWIFSLWNHGFTMNMQFLRKAENVARNVFGLGGGLVTAYALIAYSYEIKNLSHFVSRKLYHAGIAFGCYGVFTGVFPSHFIFPYILMPVEVFRGASAVFITYFITRALNIFDIETRKKIEQQTRLIVQTEKLSSLGQLAAGIAHEINNPLTNASLGIQTLKQKLKNMNAEKGIEEKISAVERNIDRASSIAQELLQFSRQRESEFIPLNINNVINGTLTLLRYKLDNITIHQDLRVVPDVMGDPGKLEQVFINILSNSIEAMPEGGAIYISASQKDGAVHVSITDTGAGIPDSHLSRVFDPFFTTKEPGAGTGLGLSICYGIIKQHQGAIEITSEVGRGTTVTISMSVRG